ncbi:hypothetical protein A2316_02005 [Candidatus Falkowbacteria bacterium RIFOXYB2_FULL_38_15]|uniref:Uncharacterized protein n=1 Tax=Candidatus Falkowbacteria bacterium RIFOXYA2_FULL_38_12 TaxID=1797993 RepID=A0A1F5S3T8_9BACT|nr:MAG: hypothetical protein A2257_00790 [Candidatus Falkowbacteria bacterium RIFOXYA2_FULL_38_12]OGF33269.1 MAG: hypothetical protein A2316_02005 [Candidatus Falkowbacteria bacterium RIFOXYB2_FULL_38_15]OGF42356.1 MAG: hypothetical protein A2555_00190 [Candidatus Falkowbacteria bacterium RIFOXYD2_FULL_39_16]
MDLVTTGAALAVGKKIFGKTLDVISADIANLYQKGRDKIIEKVTSKIANIDDGKTANLRVTRDVFWNGSFTDEAICAEYFGGILASSRSIDGKDNSGVYYVDIIKSLSSKQLLLHYAIYSSLNKILTSNPDKIKLNPGQENELQKEQLFLSTNELLKIIDDNDFGRDLHALHAKGLIGDFQTDSHKLKNEQVVPNLKVSPKSLGIQLYAVAYNKLTEWRNFTTVNFGEFDDIESPNFYGQNIMELLDSAGIKDEEVQNKEEN